MQIPNSDKSISFYILDVIISVGYRVKYNIIKHTINIFKEQELIELTTCKICTLMC